MVTRRAYRNLVRARQQRKRRVRLLSIATIGGLVSGAFLLQAFHVASSYFEVPVAIGSDAVGQTLKDSPALVGLGDLKEANGRPQLSPLPKAQEVWECEVVVVGGTLGGVGAAAHAMQAGAQTCLIELMNRAPCDFSKTFLKVGKSLSG